MNLYMKIENDLRAAIIAGQLKPGDKVPSVNDLRGKYDVSHITVRRVYQNLGAKKLIRKHGLGYIVQGKEQNESQVRTNTIGSFLRPPRPRNNYDNFFNDIHDGIERECALRGMNFYAPHICSCLAQPYTLTREKLERFIPAMKECAKMVDAYIVDERIPDDILAEVMSEVDKPFMLVNRRSELPDIDAVAPSSRENLQRGLEAARQMRYDALLYLQTGRPQQKELTEAFERYRNDWAEVRVVPDCSIEDWKVTNERLLLAMKELLKKKRRILIFSEGGGLYKLLLDYILEHSEYRLGENCGIMISQNYGYPDTVPIRPARFVVKPEKIAELAIENLLERLKDRNRPYNCYNTAPEIDLGESMYPISPKP
jgi:DNA-binding LacI/PurR family transcriptional regulator